MSPSDLLKRIDTDLLYPPFAAKVEELVQALLDDGEQFYATCGMRSFEEQARIYAYGRTDMSRGILTKAKPGTSAHQYGLAVDFCHDANDVKPGLQPDWTDAKYQILADKAVELDLDAGYYWKSIHDGPHIQLRLAKHGLTVPQLFKIYQDGESDICGVWAFLDNYDWS